MADDRRQREEAAIALLESYDYGFIETWSVEKLELLVIRAQRGLPSYQYKQVRVHELRDLCEQRNVFFPNIVIGKPYMKTVLEIMDSGAKFERFEDLPTELRVRIYEIHFDDTYYDKKGGCSMKGPDVQHPVIRVSRLLRREALPVFYDTVRLCISVRLSSDEIEPKDILMDHFELETHTAKFFENAPETVLSKYKKILLDGATRAINRYYARCRREIDLAHKGKKAEVRFVEQKYNRPQPGEPDGAKFYMKRAIKIWLKQMGERDAQLKLWAEDGHREIPELFVAAADGFYESNSDS